MKKIKFLLATSAVISVSNVAEASQWFDDREIEYLYSGQVGNRYSVSLTGTQPNPSSCAYSGDIVIEENNPKFKEIWSMLLAARMANMPVSIYVSGCDTVHNKPILTDVRL